MSGAISVRLQIEEPPERILFCSMHGVEKRDRTMGVRTERKAESVANLREETSHGMPGLVLSRLVRPSYH
jgi:hypothetical protein